MIRLHLFLICMPACRPSNRFLGCDVPVIIPFVKQLNSVMPVLMFQIRKSFQCLSGTDSYFSQWCKRPSSYHDAFESKALYGSLRWQLNVETRWWRKASLTAGVTPVCDKAVFWKDLISSNCKIATVDWSKQVTHQATSHLATFHGHWCHVLYFFAIYEQLSCLVGASFVKWTVLLLKLNLIGFHVGEQRYLKLNVYENAWRSAISTLTCKSTSVWDPKSPLHAVDQLIIKLNTSVAVITLNFQEDYTKLQLE